MDLIEAFRAEVEAKIGHRHTLAMPDREPTYDDFSALFPATTEGRVEAARAAGYGTAASTRGDPDATRRRRSFMRQLQRYSTTATEKRTPPRRLRAREANIVRSQWRRAATPANARAVLRLMHRVGATVTAFVGTFSYEARRRDLSRFAVGIKPQTLHRAGFTSGLIAETPIPWGALADAFILAFGRAYGMGDYAGTGVAEVEEFSVRVGFSEQAQYQFGTGSRPAGAPRASGNKYRGKRAS